MRYARLIAGSEGWPLLMCELRPDEQSFCFIADCYLARQTVVGMSPNGSYTRYTGGKSLLVAEQWPMQKVPAVPIVAFIRGVEF